MNGRSWRQSGRDTILPMEAQTTRGVTAEFRGLVETYLQERVDRKTMGVKTARGAGYCLMELGRAHGDRAVSDLDQASIDRYLDHYAEASAGYLRKVIAVAEGWTKWLRQRGLLQSDPLWNVEKPSLPRYMPRALDAAQVQAVFEACTNPRDVLIVSLMVNEGLRCVEVARLQVGDLDLRGRTMRIWGKGDHERMLPITDETWSCLRIYFEQAELIGGPLIRDLRFGENAVTAQRVSDVLRKVMTDTDVKRQRYDRISAHSLRHTAATDMLRNGAHVRDVQHVLGHANLKTTETYMPLVVNDLRSAMNGRSYRHPELGGAS